MPERLRIFISSPGDVGLERDLAEQVVRRLDGEFGGRVDLETVRWEDRPLLATASFQAQIVPPSATDIVVCILWSRLGSPLSTSEYSREDGSHYRGTEWEFEDAVEGFRRHGRPQLLTYRRMQEPQSSLKDRAKWEERAAQYAAVEDFIQKWFHHDDQHNTAKGALKPYNTPDELEKLLENDLRTLILSLPQLHNPVAEPAGTTVVWPKCPFRGLETFDLEHAPIYFGRTRAIGEIKQAIADQDERGCAFLLIFGMSGCGKSSLMKAGVLATLIRPGVVEGVGLWRWCLMQPAQTAHNLCDGLAAALCGDTALPELKASGAGALAQMLAEAPHHAVVPIGMALQRAADEEARRKQSAKSPKPRLIVLVDQLEELFTIEQITPQARQQFVAALGALARSGSVWVLATMRSDYYPCCAELPELLALKEGRGQYDLVPPSFDEIGQMIAYPSRLSGLKFEINPTSGQRLDAVIHEEAARDPHGLPLLSFLLRKLYEERSEDGCLTFAAYTSLQGLGGALASKAEDIFSSLPPAAQDNLRRVLRELVTFGQGADIAAARSVSLNQLENSADRRALVEAFIGERLLVTDLDQFGQPVVRIAHEALLSRWPRIDGWLRDDRANLRIRDRIAENAARWDTQGRPADLLLQAGKPLGEAEELERVDFPLTPLERAFIIASRASGRRRRRARRAAILALSVLTVLAVGFGLAAMRARSEAQHNATLAAEERNVALASVSTLINDVQDQIQDTPSLHNLKLRLLDKALASLQRITVSLASSDAQADALTGTAQMKVGEVWLTLGRVDEARTLFQAALATFEKLARAKPSDVRTQRDLAAVLDALGGVRQTEGKTPDAHAFFQRALQIRQPLAAAHADDIELQRELAISYDHLGDVSTALDTTLARRNYDQSLKIREQIVRAVSNDPQANEDVSISYEKLGSIVRREGGLQQARKFFEHELKARQDFVADNPQDLQAKRIR